MNSNNPDDPLFHMLVAYYKRAGVNITIPAEPNTRQEELVLTLLERLNDEPACEFAHTNTVCGAHVTHRAKNCAYGINVCDTATDWLRTQILNGIATCDKCDRPVADCWKIHAA